MQTLQRPSFKNNYLFQIQIFLVDIQARSSNVNEVIRAVLNSLYFYYYCFFFLQKDFTRTKSTKSTKMQPSKSTKRRTKSTKSTMTQSNKSTKRCERTVRVWWSHYTMIVFPYIRTKTSFLGPFKKLFF